MPVYLIKCDVCNHEFKSLVLVNTQTPKEWVCSRCGSHGAEPIQVYNEVHPLENNHGSGCPCCGNVAKNTK